MEEDDKNDEMLRNTVKSIDDSPKSTFCSKKTVTIIIIVVSILLLALITGIILYLVLNSNEDDSKEDDSKKDVLKGLLERQFPEIKDRFEFIIEESPESFFEISSSGSDPLTTKITIKGNNKLSISSGLGYYLRYHALSQISWTGDSLKNIKNKKLPPLKDPIKKISKLKYSYYMNTCTHSYSASWWDWPRWEREIDWMALNGINLPLAFTGLEYVTRKLFKELGFTNEELKNWFTGPAFMAWYRMGNINAGEVLSQMNG